MNHKMWYDTRDEILYLEFLSDYLTSDIGPIKEKINELLNGKPYRQMVIIISMNSKVENRETREQSNKALHDTGITDVAFIGGSAANRVIAKILLKTGAIKTKGNFFKNVQDGVNWLKNRR